MGSVGNISKFVRKNIVGYPRSFDVLHAVDIVGVSIMQSWVSKNRQHGHSIPPVNDVMGYVGGG